MIDRGKRDVLGVSIDIVDYDAAVERIVAAAKRRVPYGVSALAVHGVMTGVDDGSHRHRLNSLELVTPDGMPVRWALNLIHRVGLPDRVYGPELSRRLIGRAASDGLSVFFYGSTEETLAALTANLRKQHPELSIAGAQPSQFRQLEAREWDAALEQILGADPDLVFVGLGCPRQEVFAFEAREALGRPVIAVGAAFDFFAGTLREPALWVQRWGLQWLWRLISEPRRLWRRYVLLNPRFIASVVAQRLGRRAETPAGVPPRAMRFG